MPTPTVQQYLKTIFSLQGGNNTEVSMKDLAHAMSVTAGTATAMAQKLSNQALITYTPRQGVLLKQLGKDIAVKLVKRHRLIEAFLVKVLHYDWSEVHIEAEELEHVVSDAFVERIDSLLNYPQTDPHGNPIPRSNIKENTSPSLQRLTDITKGKTVQIARLENASSELLKLAQKHKVVPGNIVTIQDSNETTQTLTLQVKDAQPLTLSWTSTLAILVHDNIQQ